MTNPNQLVQHPEVDEQLRADIYERVAAFADSPERELAAGPDIRKATDVNPNDLEKLGKLGFGSYGELEKAAVAWRTEEDVRDAKEAHKLEARTKEVTYQKEMKAFRNERDAANERIDSLSYRAKLLGGGSVALERNPNLAEQHKHTAIAQAKAEGYSVDHLAPRAAEVVQKPEAEKRSAELASLLRAADKALLTGTLKVDKEKVHITDAEKQPALFEVPAEPGEKLVSIELPAATPVTTNKLEQEVKPAENKETTLLDELSAKPEVNEASEQRSLMGMLKRKFTKTRDNLSQAINQPGVMLGAVKKWSRGGEGNERNKARTAVVLGAIGATAIVGAIVYKNNPELAAEAAQALGVTDIDGQAATEQIGSLTTELSGELGDVEVGTTPENILSTELSKDLQDIEIGAGAEATADPVETAKPTNFDIGEGDGITDSIINLSLAPELNLPEVDATQAHDIYEQLKSEFNLGQEISNTYEMPNGDYGYNRTGAAQWSPEAIARVEELIKETVEASKKK